LKNTPSLLGGISTLMSFGGKKYEKGIVKVGGNVKEKGRKGKVK
jgi:hypothetical protein